MGCNMGKTVALKLTEKEEQIITHLNKQGMSNSEVLRSALHQFFKTIENPCKEIVTENKTFPQEDTDTPTVTSLRMLNQEVQELKEQTKRSQDKLESEIAHLQRTTYKMSMLNPSIHRITDPFRMSVVTDIHHEVDEFLKKRNEQKDLLIK